MTKKEIIAEIKEKFCFWNDERNNEYNKHGDTGYYAYCDGHVKALGGLLSRLKKEPKDD
jgi:prepilin-type processing-associated H-X9-DG protein